jgi:hypothetical protein
MIKPPKITKNVEINEIIKDSSQIKINDISKAGYRLDNIWHLYDPKFLDTINETKWNDTIFLDKSYIGYSCWSNNLIINSNERPFFNTKYKVATEIIEKYFRYDNGFVRKFFDYQLIEKTKGDEKFNVKRFHLFKALFRNYGTERIINSIYDKLDGLIVQTNGGKHETKPMLASEIVSGLIRGSKYWKYDKLVELWSKLKPIFNKIFDTISNESLPLWLKCFSTAFEDQDPRRMTFYFNYFVELFEQVFADLAQNEKLNVKQTSSTLKQSCILSFLSSFAQFEWRIPKFWSKFLGLSLDCIEFCPKNVRETLSSCISNSILVDLEYPRDIYEITNFIAIEKNNGDDDNDTLKLYRLNLVKTEAASFEFLTKKIKSKIEKSIELFRLNDDDPGDDGQHQDHDREEIKRNNISEFMATINLLHAMLNSFFIHFTRSNQPFHSEIIKLVPLVVF